MPFIKSKVSVPLSKEQEIEIKTKIHKRRPKLPIPVRLDNPEDIPDQLIVSFPPSQRTTIGVFSSNPRSLSH